MRENVEPTIQISAAADQADTPVSPELLAMPKEGKTPKIKKVRKPRPWPLKILMELIAIILCLALFVVTVAGALVVDLRVMTSRGAINEILTQLIMPSMAAPSADSRAAAAADRTSVQLLSNTTAAPDTELSGPLTDLVYSMLQSQLGQDLPVTKEQVSDFLAESTVPEFLSDKLADAVEDFYNGTNTATITREDVVGLLRDNAPLIRDSFGISITEEHLQQMQTALEEIEVMDTLEEQGLMAFLDEAYPDEGSGTDSSLSGGSAAENMHEVKQILEYIRKLTSNTAIACAAGAFVLLALLLFLVNGTVPKTLSDLGITLFFAGLLLSSVNFIGSSGILQMLVADYPAGVGVITGVLNSIAVVHYSILGAGIALILLAIVTKIIKSNRCKKALSAIQ